MNRGNVLTRTQELRANAHLWEENTRVITTLRRKMTIFLEKMMKSQLLRSNNMPLVFRSSLIWSDDHKRRRKRMKEYHALKHSDLPKRQQLHARVASVIVGMGEHGKLGAHQFNDALDGNPQRPGGGKKRRGTKKGKMRKTRMKRTKRTKRTKTKRRR